MEEKKRDAATGALLRTAAALMFVLALFAALVVVLVAAELYETAPEYRFAFWPCVAYTAVGAVPCAAALGAFCRLIALIQSERSFTRESEKCVRFIAVMALTECAYMAAGEAAMLISGVGAPWLCALLLTLLLAFLCVGLMALALARLIHRAALLREDNELTV